jgi:serine/threonine protein kinase
MDDREKLYALKIFDPAKSKFTLESIKKSMESEIEAYQQLDHRYIMKMVDYSLEATKKKYDGTEKQVAYMVMEYAANGDLSGLQARRPFSADTSRYFFN